MAWVEGGRMIVRASIGTLAAAKLLDVKALAEPGVAYLLQYSESGCEALCAFCAQSKFSRAPKDLLSRVLWPPVKLEELVPRLAKVFSRACVQSVLKPGFVEELHKIVRVLSSHGLSVSLSTTPLPSEELETFRSEGVDYLGVGLDAATPEVALRVGKPYSFHTYLDFVRRGVKVFGRGRVVVHLVVGLGETFGEALSTIKLVHSLGAAVSLFAFVPVKGTPTESWPRPSIKYYRLLQLANYALSRGIEVEEVIDLKRECVRARALRIHADLVEALLTRGCPGCNRPYYTEPPRGELYNYPSRELLPGVTDALKGLTCDVE